MQTAIFYPKRGTYMNFEFYARHDKSIVTETSYTDHKISKAFAKRMIEGKGQSFTTHIKGNKVKEWLSYQMTTNVFIDKYLNTAPSLNYYWHSLGPVALGISTYAPLSKPGIPLFNRYLDVFELAYKRYTDIEKAEAQAREAQIETSLERVRSRSLAMHKSDELKEAGELLWNELGKLGIESLSSGYVLMDKEEKIGWTYAPNPATGRIADPLGLLHTETKEMLKVLSCWKKQELLSVIEMTEEETIAHQTFVAENALQTNGGISHWITAEQLIALSPKKLFLHNFNFKQGYLMIVGGNRLIDTQNELMLRFTRVFQQTYTRFLDLQKAEAQAREAKIEAALERVRSRSMAMRKSEELREVVALLYEQMEPLGMARDGCELILCNEQTNQMEFWHSNPIQSVMPECYYVPRLVHPICEEQWAAWKEGASPFTIELKGAKKHDFETVMLDKTDFKRIPEEIKKWILEQKVSVLSHVTMKYGLLEVVDAEPLSEERLLILQRFSKVFEQTYTRFLDLQKAEGQAHEAQIEASLEKVRSRSLAMHKSDELREVVAVLLAQLQAIGFDSFMSMIGLIDRQTKDYDVLMSSDVQAVLPQSYHVPYFENEFRHEFIRTFEANIPYKVFDFSGQVKRDFDKLFFTITDFRNLPEETKQMMMGIDNCKLCCAFMSYGCIEAIGMEELSPQQAGTLQRFAKVFEQCYTRFLDLQKAEGQAREAQIEAALERVRNKAMAMQSSEDVVSSTSILFIELEKLGIKTMRCGVLLFDESQTMEMWSSAFTNETQVTRIIGRLDMTIHPLLQGVFKSWKNKDEVYCYKLIGDDIHLYYSTVAKAHNPYYSELAQDPSVPDHFCYVYYFEEGGVYTFSVDDQTEETKQILKKFTAVFALTFRRYQDLKNAEAQAREAQIETSLERLRSKTMAMHNSNDVSAATAVMFNELSKLSVENMRCGIGVMREDSDTMEVWAASVTGDGHEVKGMGQVGVGGHALWQEMYHDWKLKKETFLYHLLGEDKRAYYRALMGEQRYSTSYLAEEQPDHYCYVTFFTDGGIFTFNQALYSDEQKQILKRFATVFSLTYRRYKDLKTAEAQAREATIQASLERVRAKAMAMHSSEDLNSTIRAFYQELGSLNLTPRRCGVGLLDKATRSTEISTMNTTEGGETIELVGKLELVNHPVLEGIYDHWLAKKEYHPVLRGNEIKEYYQLVRPQVAFPDYPSDSIQFGYFFYFDEGAVYAWTEKHLDEDELHIYRRFTSVLSLTYKRYRDLKDAESRAKEAIRQASLDRVRAEIASMRSVQDLDRITPLIWRELTTLGIPFVRCGVFIMDDEEKLIHTFLSTPDGKAIAAFHLPFDTATNLTEAINGWRTHKRYVTRWVNKDFQSQADVLVQQGSIANREQYLNAIPKDGIYLHFLPFLQGMLYVGHTSALGDDDLNLVQAVADAFSTAYARYEDFNKLEAAKKQVDRSLTDLRQAQQQLVQSEKMASLGELTAGIAHEIQNPLNFVNNFSEVSKELLEEMKDGLAAGNQQQVTEIANDIIQNLEKIHHHGKRAGDIVKSMLQHSRTGTGQKELTDINALCEEYLRLAYHGLRAKDKSFNARFETDFDSKLPKILVLPQDMGRVILNLINNAFYAANEKKKMNIKGYEPTVTVSTRNFGDKIEIKVKDNGMGIPEKVKEKIFQPFFTTKPTGQGTGLGLSLSYDIIKVHGGDIKVETQYVETAAEAGQGESGTTFTIKLLHN